jgi:succinoglycan biosynthesis protein ExoM
MTTSANTNSRVAVCICTHNRSQLLQRLLASIADIDLTGYHSSKLDIIVVDNSCDEETAAVCNQAGQRLPMPVHYVQEPQAGITYARNTAAKEALSHGADFVAFIDDDDLPRPNWLVTLLDRQAVTHADLVFGTWILDASMPAWARESGIFRSTKSKGDNRASRYHLPHCASTCNVLAGRDILVQIGAEGPIFNHAFRFSGGEDKDFFIRASRAGAKLASADGSVIQRNHETERYTLRGLFDRGFKSGCSNIYLARVHGSWKRIAKLVVKSLLKLIMSLILLPFSVFSKRNFMHNIYRIARSCGTVYAATTGRRINYYSRG